MSILCQQCPKIVSLTINHELDIEETLGTAFESDFDFGDGIFELRESFATQDLSPFSNLRELRLGRIHGDLSHIRDDIVKVLLKSPNIRTLSLSLNPRTMFRLHQENTLQAGASYLDFFPNLIDSYVAGNGKPLQLRTLELGLGVILWEEESEDPASYLADLTELELLEEVYMCNKGVETALIFMEPDMIAWNTFIPEVCPKLSIVGFYGLTSSAEAWFQMLEPGYLSQIEIQQVWDYDLPDFNTLLERQGADSGSGLTKLTIFDASYSINISEPPRLFNLEALSLGLRAITMEQKPKFLSWVRDFKCLKQLRICYVDPRPNCPIANDYETLGREIAHANEGLEYLGLEDYYWRIWHRGEDNGDCYLERLDRFESREVTAFKTERKFYPDIM